MQPRLKDVGSKTAGSITDRFRAIFLAIPQRWPAGTLQPLAHAWPLPPLLSFFADLRCFCARLPKSDAKAPRLLATGATLFYWRSTPPCARATLLTEPMLPFAQTKMMRSCLLLLTACFRSAYAVQCCNAEHQRCDRECTACASCSGWGCLACGHCIPCTPYIECGPYSSCHTGMYIGLGVGAPALTHFSE